MQAIVGEFHRLEVAQLRLDAQLLQKRLGAFLSHLLLAQLVAQKLDPAAEEHEEVVRATNVAGNGLAQQFARQHRAAEERVRLFRVTGGAVRTCARCRSRRSRASARVLVAVAQPSKRARQSLYQSRVLVLQSLAVCFFHLEHGVLQLVDVGRRGLHHSLVHFARQSLDANWTQDRAERSDGEG